MPLVTCRGGPRGKVAGEAAAIAAGIEQVLDDGALRGAPAAGGPARAAHVARERTGRETVRVSERAIASRGLR